MNILATLCFAGALLAMVYAIVFQRRDLHPERGGSMGGEMTAGLIWLVASLLGALGSLAFVPWYGSILVFFGIYAFSFLVRSVVARIPKRAG